MVDVGGGVGTSALSLAARFPDLNIIVQDLPKVVEDGKKVVLSLPYCVPLTRISLEYSCGPESCQVL